MIRERWPNALVRRASQAERAHNPDVFVEGGPKILQRLWLELQDAAHPTPSEKLEQARRDIRHDPRSWRVAHGEWRIPVAVTHKRGAQRILVTMNVGDMLNVIDLDGHHVEDGELSMDFDQFLGFVARKGQAEDVRPPPPARGPIATVSAIDDLDRGAVGRGFSNGFGVDITALARGM